MRKEIEGFMCSTDWEDELGEASGGVPVYASAEDLRRHRGCVKVGGPHGCRTVKVRVRFVAEIVEPPA